MKKLNVLAFLLILLSLMLSGCDISTDSNTESNTSTESGSSTSGSTDTSGTESDSSTGGSTDTSDDTSVPAAPQNLTAIIYQDQIYLSWDSVPEATSYTIYEGQSFYTSFATVLADEWTNTYAFITPAAENTTYYFWVKAVNANGESIFSDSVSIYFSSAGNDTSVPATPQNLTATIYQNQYIYLSWNSVSEATSYTIYEGQNSYTSSATVLADEWANTYALITPAAENTTYYFWVKAVNANGESNFSDSVSIYFSSTSGSTETVTVDRIMFVNMYGEDLDTNQKALVESEYFSSALSAYAPNFYSITGLSFIYSSYNTSFSPSSSGKMSLEQYEDLINFLENLGSNYGFVTTEDYYGSIRIEVIVW